MAIRRALLAVRVVCVFVFAAATAIFAWAFYTRYYASLDCFNELGRCYDPDGSGEV